MIDSSISLNLSSLTCHSRVGGNPDKPNLIFGHRRILTSVFILRSDDIISSKIQNKFFYAAAAPGSYNFPAVPSAPAKSVRPHFNNFPFSWVIVFALADSE